MQFGIESIQSRSWGIRFSQNDGTGRQAQVSISVLFVCTVGISLLLVQILLHWGLFLCTVGISLLFSGALDCQLLCSSIISYNIISTTHNHHTNIYSQTHIHINIYIYISQFQSFKNSLPSKATQHFKNSFPFPFVGLLSVMRVLPLSDEQCENRRVAVSLSLSQGQVQAQV